MKHLFLKFTKKTFGILFLGMSLLIMSQEMQAATYTTAQSGAWTTPATWVGGVVPTVTSADTVIIDTNHVVTFTLAANFSVGALNVKSGASLTVSGATFTFTIGSVSPYSTISGTLAFDSTTTGSKSIGNLTVDSGASLTAAASSGAISIGSGATNSSSWVNNGTISIQTLGLSTSKTIENNKTFTCTFGSTSAGVFNNNSAGTLTLNGGIAGTINNYGIINSNNLNGSATTAVLNNKSTGVLNFTNAAMVAANLVLNASEAGNTVNYSGTTQTIKDVNYSNLILSTSGTKTWSQSADRTVAGDLTINSGVTLRVSSVGVSSVAITSGGSGYGTTVPTVTFAAPAAGATATGIAFLTTGAVSSIVVTNAGSGYSSAPAITFSGSGGATATATLAAASPAYKFTVNGTTTNNGTINFDSFAGTGDKTFATFNNPGTITSSVNANFIFTTADYSGAAQTVLPGTYTNLTLSGSGTKTIGTAASGTLCTGKMTITGTAKATVTNTNVGVNTLVLGTTGQLVGTIGGTGSGATTINTTYFNAVTGTLNVQNPYAITSTAVGGDWNTASTWVDGVVPTNSNADYVVIVGTATVTLNLTANFTVGALNINQGGKLTVSQDATARTFTLGTRTPGSTIAGALLFDASVTGGKTVGNVTVTATGSIIETTTVSISVTAGYAITNNGTITTNTLAPTAANTNVYNYGTMTVGGFSSGTLGSFTNYGSGTLNYAGASMPSAMTFTASATGNTVNYNGTTQAVRIPNTGSYSKLILSNSGTKTIDTAASGTLCTGTMTISGTAKANVTNTNVAVDKLFLGTTGQSGGTIGFTGSGATTINTAYFATGLGTLNVQQTYIYTSTAAGGDWNTTSTWVDGVVPSNSNSDYVVIVGTATVTLNLTSNFTVGALDINQGGTLNVSSDASANTFTLGTRSPGSTIAGNLLFDASVTGGKTFGNVNVSSTGSVVETTKVSISVTAGYTLTNYGTITTATLAPTAANATVNNYGTINATGFSSGTLGSFTNYSSGTLNYAGASMPSAMTFTASATGNTVNYNGTTQAVRTPNTGSYSKLILSNSGTKTIDTAASGTLCTGTMTISGTAKANVTNTNVAVDKLFLGTTGQAGGTIGFTGSGATTINTTYFATGLGTLNVQQTYAITSTAAGGDWNTPSTWVDGVVPSNSSADYVVIVAGAPVTLTLTQALTVGALDINQGGTLNVTGAFGFSIASRSPFSTIAGNLNLDGTTGSKSFGNLTVASSGIISSLGGATSIGSSAASSSSWVNNGTITVVTLGLTAAKAIENNGTFTASGIGSTGSGTFNNNSAGIFNYSGGSIPGPVTLTATAVGNTVNYNGTTSQTVKDTGYSNLTLSGTGTKTLQQAADRTVSGNLTIGSGVTLNVSSASVTSVTIPGGNEGTLYTVAPTATFDAAPSGGTTATGTAVLSGGVVSSVTITNPGSGYTSAPTVTFTGGTTTGTAATTATTTIVALPTAYKFTVEGTTTNNGTLNFDAFAGTGDITITTFNNPGTITSSSSANFICSTADYSGAAQTILPGTYSTLTLSGSGTKTIGTAASGTLCTGTMTISGTAKANVTNANVSVNKLILGTTGQAAGTIGFTGSGATTINTAYFVTGLGTLNVQQSFAFTSTAAGGDWNSASTWENGVVPSNSNADYVVIVGTATVTLNLTSNFTVGALDINQGGTLNVSSNASANTFTLGTKSPGSTIAGALLFDASVTGGKIFGTSTVTATGSVIETTKVSISVTAGTAITNYGTITTGTLAPTAVNTNVYNYGTINTTGFSSVTLGSFTNYGSSTLNYSGGTIPAAMTFTASDAGNTVNYNGTTQTVRIPNTGSYSKLILSNSGTKTIDTAASGTLCTGTMTISGTAKANVTNTNVAVDKLFLGTAGQAGGTIGFTGSGATTINTAYFITGLGTLNVQQTYIITSTAAGGDWNTPATWVDGVVPSNSNSDYVVIVGTATVTLNLTSNFTVGALDINQGGALNVSSDASANTFTLGTRSPGSTIAGALLFDASVTGGKTVGNVTVTATGSIIETTKVSISITAGYAITNYGTITTNTLAPTAVNTDIYNYGTFNAGGFSSATQGTFTNYSAGTLNFGGTVAGNLKNYGIVNATSMTSGALYANNFFNYSTGVLNFTGASMTSTNLVLDTSDPGNTVNYSFAGNQTVKDVVYSNLILSNSGTKTIPTAASGTLCTAKLTISGAGGSGGVRANVTNANVSVNLLFLGSSGQANGTIGFTGSGATTINTTYFVTGTGTLNVQQNYAITSTAAGGDWNTASTWVDGVVPSNANSDYVVIVGTATVTLNLTSNFTVGALNINQGGKLTVSQDATARSFTLGTRTPGSTIAGALLFDASVTGAKTVGNLTVTSTGSVIETTKVSISVTAGTAITNNGTITTNTLAPTAVNTNVYNYGTMNVGGFSSQTLGTFINYGTGVFNYGGGTIPAAMTFTASEAGNTVNYNGTTQTVKDQEYSNLIFTGSGTTKTWYQAADRTVGNLTINTGSTLKVTSASIVSVAIDNPGSGYGTTVPTVTIANGTLGSGGTAAASATAILTGGAVTSIMIATAGSGYTAAPTVTIAAPASGTTATATATILTSTPTYKLTVTGTTTNSGTLNFDSFAGTGDKTFATFNNPGTITSAVSANFIFATADYSASGAQTVLPGTYTNLTLSGSGTKTIGTAASGTLCTGKMTISGAGGSGGVRANVTNTNVAVNKLILGTSGQSAGTIGFTGSGATTINTTYFVTGLGTLNVQQTYAITSTAVGGDWNTTSTWVDGVVPANSNADYVVIVGTATVTLTLTSNFTVGALDINQGGKLTVSQDATTRTFALGTRTPGSTIAGALLFDATVTGGKTFGNVTVTSTGSVIETTKVSISVTAGTAITNYGTITTSTLAPTAVNTNVYNYGTMNVVGLSSQTLGAFINYSTGVFNYGGSTIPAAMTFTASEAGNTVNYNGTSQTVKDLAYSNLILSGSGTKTWYQAADRTVGTLTINTGTTLKVTSASVISVAINNPGSGYGTTVPAVTIANGTLGSGGTAAASATAMLTGGTVSSIMIATAGSGYTAAPTVTIAAPASGTTATATATILTSTPTYKFTVTGTTTNSGTLNFDSFAGTGDKTFATFNNPGTITSAVSANFIFATADYSASGAQTVLPGTYTNLTLSGSGTKTIGTAASGTLCTGKMTISGAGGSGGVRANVTNTNVTVNLLFLGSTGQTAGTIGFTGSGATTINTTYFVTGLGTLNVQQTYAITSTAAGGDWNTASTWVDGVVPANSSADYVVIVAGAPVTLTLTAAFNVGAIKINSGGTLNVTGAYSFAIASRSPYSNIAGSLNLDATTLSKSFGTITVASGGVISSLGGATSVASTASSSSSWVNNGTLTVVTLGLTAAKAIENNGTFTASGIGSTGSGTFNNNSGATLNLSGTIAANINNFGIMNSTGFSGTSAVANVTNKATGVLNFTGGSMTSTTLVLDASAAGNTVNYSLAGNQIIKPATYSNLILSNSGTKTVDVATSITIPTGGLITVNEGITLNNLGTISNNGDILLKSTATGSASLTSTSSIDNVTQQRYLSSNQRGWRLISNPLASTTFNTLAAASGITIGNSYTGEYMSASNTWTSTDGADVMDTQKAYKVFITGLSGESPAYTTGPSNVTLVNKGTAPNTEPAAISTTLGEYYLVANPYTAPVSVASIIAASTGLSSTVAYYNPTNGSTDVKVKAGGYDTATADGTAGGATDVVIPAMGAIFMQASSDGSINIPASTIFTGTPAQSGTYNHKSTDIKVAEPNALKIEVRSGAVYYDAISLHFKAVGEAGSNIDFGKLPNSILNAYSIAGINKMAVSELELVDQTIPVGITSTIQKSYTFKVVENTIPAGFEAVLVDKVLNTNTVLTPGSTYNFAIDSTPASQGDARFAINLKVAGSLSVIDRALDSKIKIWPNPAHGQFNILNGQNQQDGISTIEISNLNGKMVHSYKSNPGTTTAIETKGWASGVFFIKVKNSGKQTTKKLIVQ